MYVRRSSVLRFEHMMDTLCGDNRSRRNTSFCCCSTAEIFTKIVAWCQIILSGCGFLVVLGFLIYWWSNEELKIDQVPFFIMIVIGLVTSFVMGVILLLGVKRKRPKFLMTWIVYFFICMLINFGIQAAALYGSRKIMWVLARAGFDLALGSFLIWTVAKFICEIVGWNDVGNGHMVVARTSTISESEDV